MYRILTAKALWSIGGGGLVFCLILVGEEIGMGEVAAGIGVALLSSRSIAGEVVPWSRAAHLSPTPRVVNVARAARGATTEVAKELLTDIRAELGEVPTSAR